MAQTAILTWDDVLNRKDLIGGDIESIEDGVVYRGPLAKIEIHGDTIRFKSPWCARRTKDGEWEKWNNTSSFVSREIEPQDIGNGRIHFLIPFLGFCTIFPKGDSKLDPRNVKGLASASERLLALCHNLPLDREKAKSALIEVLVGLPADATLNDLLGKFRTDDSKEEFLWSYIEAVTGEKDVRQKVY